MKIKKKLSNVSRRNFSFLMRFSIKTLQVVIYLKLADINYCRCSTINRGFSNIVMTSNIHLHVQQTMNTKAAILLVALMALVASSPAISSDENQMIIKDTASLTATESVFVDVGNRKLAMMLLPGPQPNCITQGNTCGMFLLRCDLDIPWVVHLSNSTLPHHEVSMHVCMHAGLRRR